MALTAVVISAGAVSAVSVSTSPATRHGEQAAGRPATSAATPSLAVGDAAPRICLPLLRDGTTLQVPAAGAEAPKATILSFFAFWCQPCLREMPHLARLQEKYRGKGLAVYLVCLDRSPTPVLKEHAEKFGVTLPILLDSTGWGAAFRYRVMDLKEKTTIPQAYVIDGKGIVRGHFRGFAGEESAKHLEALVAGLLNRTP